MHSKVMGCSLVAIGLLVAGSASNAFAATASAADKTFVGKVSQGGLYEVEASKVAEMKATEQYVKDQAVTEVHDHLLVNAKLKQIAAATGVSELPGLNAEFTQRLNKLKAVPRAQFDAAYVGDMKSIHDGDEKLFKQESMQGSDAYKGFAGETDKVVKQHIGALNAN
jgi:putative membrane protein